MRFVLILVAICFTSCGQSCDHLPQDTNDPKAKNQNIVSSKKNDKNSWLYFLQHLPLSNGPVLDYKGNPVPYQQKHVAIVNYDVGKRDLQQCADALIRLRAEYLFSQNRYNEIGFHFVNGNFYKWDDYCAGIRPIPEGKNIRFIHVASSEKTHESLRKYLDIVFNYASTISLARELKPAKDFAAGTVIIHPGSPGHCFIIVDEATDSNGQKVFKLAEGYSPAQSIYILSNLAEQEISPWYHLNKGTITTSSCQFISYQLGKFE